MVALCGRCGEPIRGFKGYDPEIGEICFRNLMITARKRHRRFLW
ncbi:MAG TPA: hypothetical protein VMW03_04945 [Candidatus Krumholzibacteriaceae bacterium]|nr:hypothetical protein [Candidatus Krumholzibacteriaceae bacterium]